MKTSGLFTVHSFDIPIKYGKEISIIIFGDVHRDSPACYANTKWKSDLASWRAMPKDSTYFLGMGDYLDSTSTSERECLGDISKKMHDTFATNIIELQEAKIKLIADELQFMKGRLIGLLNGNHYFQFQNLNGDQKLCEKLDAKYLGVCSFVRVNFDCHGRQHALDFFIHHGMGAARLVGGSLNRVLQMFEGAEADITIMGHDHKRGAVPATPRLYLTNSSRDGLKVKQRETWAVRSGSYLKSFEPGVANYNVDSCRSPVSLGHVEMRVRFDCKDSTRLNKNDKRLKTVEQSIRFLT